MEQNYTIVGSEKLIHISNDEYQAVLKTNLFGKFLKINVKNKWYYVVAYEHGNDYAPISDMFRDLRNLKGKKIFFTEKKIKEKDVHKLNKFSDILCEYKKKFGQITAREKALKDLGLKLSELKDSIHVKEIRKN